MTPPRPVPVSVREAREADLDAVGRLLYDFNREFDDPAPPPAQLAVRVRELLAGGDTGVVVAGGPVNFYYERVPRADRQLVDLLNRLLDQHTRD